MKKAVKALAVLLALCFCTSALMLAVGAAASDAQAAGSAFYFGMYPQSKVTDTSLTKTLDALRTSTKSDIVTYGGKTYASYRIVSNSIPGGPFGVYYGYYPCDEAHGYPTYWFVFEPIEWRVLDSDDQGVLLLSEKVLGTHAFNTAIASDNTWGSSSVRKWLNGPFLTTAFSPAEQAFIKNSKLTNEPNPVHGAYAGVPSAFAGDPNRDGVPFEGTYSGASTTDKVFLPSFNEITNPDYGFNVGWKDMIGDFGEPVGYYETDTLPGEHCGRSTGATDYAQCQGAWTHLTSDKEPLDTCFYWLRTAGYDSTYAAGVLPDGRVSTGWQVDYDVIGVRPMMRVDASAVPDDILPAASKDPAKAPFHVEASAETFHYKQKNLQLEADVPVTWTSSNPAVAQVNAQTGEVTVTGVGDVTITATSDETGETVEFPMTVRYLWWQWLIRIFLFGWVWY